MKIIKEVLISLLGIVVAFMLLFAIGKILIACGYNTYYIEAEVDSIKDDIVTFKDNRGNLWEYKFKDLNGLKNGDRVKLKMDDNDTEPIEDDKITKVIRE